MDSKTIDQLEQNDTSEETVELIKRWREIVKPGEYRISGNRWKKYHPQDMKEMNFLDLKLGSGK